MRTPRTLLALCVLLSAALATPSALAQDHLEDTARAAALQSLEDAGYTPADADAAGGGELRVTGLDAQRANPGVTEAMTLGFRCLPTCSATDGRFLALAGDNLITLSDSVLDMRVAAASDVVSFNLGVFDGDGNDPNLSGQLHWDVGSPALYSYTLYADPDFDGEPDQVVPLGGNPSVSSLQMANNDWSDFQIVTGPEAAAPSGNYFYILRIELTIPTLTTLNNFKVRVDDQSAVVNLLPSQPFSYYASWTGIDDISIIYPNFPDATPTTYNGSFSFFFDTFASQSGITVWDGDLDRGKFDGTESDTDDPNTFGVPPFANEDAFPEGVAAGRVPSTGNPPDDADGTGFGIYLLRTPSINYNVVAPDGRTFSNANPSGNQEWERFVITTGTFDPTQHDVATPTLLPAGAYEIDSIGVDMQNLNALFVGFPVVCVTEGGVPCDPLRPFLVGDTVFLDFNADGMQDAGDPGIPNVVLNLIDANGQVIDTTVTDADGNYTFPVGPATLTVQLDASNFDPGGALEGGTITTAGDNGGTEQTNTVSDGNVLTYDFGVIGGGSIGDRVWNDFDGDGVQDAGEPGLNGVTVNLTGAGADGQLGTADDVDFGSRVTSGDGDYDFTGLLSGSYRVDVDDATVPPGFVSTTNNDPMDVDLGVDEDFDDADFGYAQTGSIGDRVWNDDDGDGVQDAGEPGLNGVTVILRDEDGNELARTTTSGDGNYNFDGLFAGVYTVEIDTTTLPDGAEPTYDVDGLATPNQATVTLAPAQDRDDVDFGYDQCGACEGKVSRLTLRYDGDAPAEIRVVGKRGPSRDVLFEGVVEPGGTFEVVGPDSGNGGFRGTVGTEVKLYVNGQKVAALHTSCSVEIGPGTTAGDFTVVAGASKNGGTLCPVGGGGGGGGGNQCVAMLDFETDDDGNALSKGQVIDDEFSGFGITVSSSHARHPPMIFDSSRPTGGDHDLGTPNQDFGGPGIGSGGGRGKPGENRVAQGKVLILSEDRDGNDPDDNAGGGVLTFTFDDAVTVNEVHILDIDDRYPVRIKAYDGSGTLIRRADSSNMGNNSFEAVSVGAAGVERLDVHFAGSGAVAKIVFDCPDDNGGGGGNGGGNGGGDTGGGGDEAGTGTLGYWKNHPEAWPTSKVKVGGTYFSQSKALYYLKKSSGGWAALQLFHQLVPAKLNVLSGTDDSCIAEAIYWADVWFYYYLKGANPKDSDARALAEILDSYNNGQMCAPHRG